MIHSMIIESESKDWSGLFKLSVIADKKPYKFTVSNKREVEYIKQAVKRGFYGRAMNMLKRINVK